MRLGLASLILSVLLLPVVLSSREVTELEIETTKLPEACTDKATNGDKLLVHYTGKLFNGEVFDSSLNSGQPFSVILGKGQVIRGWEEGLQGMCAGEKRQLTIPARMAYGSGGFAGIIPPNSALVFDVELVSLEKKVAHGEL